MDPFFTEEQLNNMSRENMMEVMRIMQNQVRKKETEVQLLKDKQKELDIDEIEKVVLAEYNNTVRFTKIPLATEYRQSLLIAKG